MRAYVLSMQQQQAYDDEIYEVLNKMCNYISFYLNFYDDTILHFEDTSGTAAAEKRKVPFEDTSGAASAGQRKFDKEAYTALYQASK